MIYKVIISLLLAALLAPGSFSQQQDPIKPAYKLKDVIEFGCCGIDLELDIFIEAIRKEPGGRAHIIGYSGPGDPPGKLLRHLAYMKANLSDLMGDDSQPVSVMNGGYRDKFTIEMWIVPEGASVPAPTDSTIGMNSEADLAYKFDEAQALMMEYGKESYLSFGLACTLSYPEWRVFFGILRDNAGLRGHIIIYVGENDRARHAKRIERFLRNDLKEFDARRVNDLTMTYGGKREWAQIEIWLVPEGKPDPTPTPQAKGPWPTEIASNKFMHRAARAEAL